MKTSATNRKLRLLLTAIKNNTLVPRPEFQRRLVWTNEDKLNFLTTVLEGYPFPEIYIAAGEVNPDTGEGSEMLVDGQQRITTLYQYFNGSDELKLKQIQPYKMLTDDQKIAFLEYEVVARDLGKKSIEEIKEIFKRINSTKYSLNAMEIHNARFDGAFKKFAESIAQLDFFESNRIFTSTDIKRMNDTVFCLTFIISIMSTYFNRDDEFEDYLLKYNDEFEQEQDLNAEIRVVLNTVNKFNLPDKCRGWKKTDLLNLITEIHRALFKLKLNIDFEQMSARLSVFYDLVDNKDNLDNEVVNEYRKATLSATNDRSSRIIRGEVLKKVILGEISFK
jgi:uncharacterized protein with ParB-like and HNH nuclease domain